MRPKPAYCGCKICSARFAASSVRSSVKADAARQHGDTRSRELRVLKVFLPSREIASLRSRLAP